MHADRRTSMLEAARSSEALASIRGRGRKGIQEFAALMEHLAPYRDGDAGVVLDALLESIERERWLTEMDDGDTTVDREANVEELRAHAHEYDRLNPEGKLAGFL